MRCKTSAHGAFKSHYNQISYTSNINKLSYSSINTYSIPSSTTLTYSGLFNENYFLLTEKNPTKDIYSFELSNASIINPLTNKREYYLGLLLKSKYDGKGIREPIDIGLSIDISGSMRGDSIYYTKKSIYSFLDNLNNNDNICINVFNDEDKLIIPFQKKNESSNIKNIIDSLEADGGTDIYKGLNGIYNELKNHYNEGNKSKRIIIITDMMYSHDTEFIDLCHQISKEKIYLTILGISENFNTELVEEIAHIEGSNYYVINNVTDIENYLVKDFNFVCFPSSFKNSLEINAPFLTIESVIGTGKKSIKKDEMKLEWNQDNHLLYDKNFRDGIFYMLCYFKKRNKILPKPVILCISKYIQTSHIKIISLIDTLFPSNLKQVNDNVYVEGGMFLLRLNDKNIKKNNYIQFNMKYKSAVDNKNYEIISEYEFDKVENDDFYSSKAIEKALGLYYFAKYNRILMKYCNNENKNKNNKYIKDIIENYKVDEIKNKIQKFFDLHYGDNNSDNYKKYILNSNKIISDSKQNIYGEAIITSEEFIKVGDYLISKYKKWKWYDDINNLFNEKLPKNKQYLKASFYSSERLKDYLEKNKENKEEQEDIEDMLIDNDTYGDDNDKNNNIRKYDVYISYDTCYNFPRIWFIGYDFNNNILSFEKIKEDIIPDKINDCIIETMPFIGIKCFTINPCKHPYYFNKILQNFNGNELLIILLKYTNLIIPTIIKRDIGKDIMINFNC